MDNLPFQLEKNTNIDDEVIDLEFGRYAFR